MSKVTKTTIKYEDISKMITIKHLEYYFYFIMIILYNSKININIFTLINININIVFIFTIINDTNFFTKRLKNIPVEKLLQLSPMVCLIAPIIEEIIFRYLLLNTCNYFIVNSGKYISSIIFGLAHMSFQDEFTGEKNSNIKIILYCISTGFFGYLLTYIDSLFVKIILHIYYNLLFTFIEIFLGCI